MFEKSSKASTSISTNDLQQEQAMSLFSQQTKHAQLTSISLSNRKTSEAITQIKGNPGASRGATRAHDNDKARTPDTITNPTGISTSRIKTSKWPESTSTLEERTSLNLNTFAFDDMMGVQQQNGIDIVRERKRGTRASARQEGYGLVFACRKQTAKDVEAAKYKLKTSMQLQQLPIAYTEARARWLGTFCEDVLVCTKILHPP
ncbi:hypothetical protein V8E51_002981 [Hyaloscypha variabilis]